MAKLLKRKTRILVGTLLLRRGEMGAPASLISRIERVAVSKLRDPYPDKLGIITRRIYFRKNVGSNLNLQEISSVRLGIGRLIERSNGDKTQFMVVHIGAHELYFYKEI